jgi:hypothetical protein
MSNKPALHSNRARGGAQLAAMGLAVGAIRTPLREPLHRVRQSAVVIAAGGALGSGAIALMRGTSDAVSRELTRPRV